MSRQHLNLWQTAAFSVRAYTSVAQQIRMPTSAQSTGKHCIVQRQLRTGAFTCFL